MKKGTVALLLALLFASGLQEASAQSVIQVGPRAGFDIAGDVEELFIGADGRITLPSLPIILNGTFDFYFTEENVTFYQISFNALYEFGVDNQVFTPYAGLGLGISRTSVDVGIDGIGSFEADNTDLGLNAIGGAIFGSGGMRPYAQAQITFGDVDLFTVGGGLLFVIGGN